MQTWTSHAIRNIQISYKVSNIIDCKRTIFRAILIIDIYDSFSHVIW